MDLVEISLDGFTYHTYIVKHAFKMGVTRVFMVTSILGHNTPLNWPVCVSVNVHVSTTNFSTGKTVFLCKGLT